MEMNTPEIQTIFDAFSQKAEPEFFKYFEGKIKELNHFIASYEKHFSKLEAAIDEQADLVERVKAHNTFKENVLKSLLAYQQDLQTGDFNNLFADFIREAENEINQLDESITGERNKAIPFRNMARFYLLHQFAENAREIFRKAMQGKSRALVALWEFDAACDNAFQPLLMRKADNEPDDVKDISLPDNPFKHLKQENKALLQKIKTETRNISHQVFHAFDETFKNALPKKRSKSGFKQHKLNKQQQIINAAYASETGKWKNTHHVLLDDWAVDVEITQLYYSVYDQYHLLKSNADTLISQRIDKSFSDIRSFITNSGKRIEKSPASSKKTAEVLGAERDKIGKDLVDKILARSAETFTNCFSEDFEVFQEKVMDLAGKVSDKRGFIRSKDFDQGINDSEISNISPRELLKVEAIPHFRENVDILKTQIDGHLEKVRLTLLSLGTVCDFNLESALIYLNEPEKTVKEAAAIALEGYERALNQLEEAQGLILEIQNSIGDDLRDAVNNFNGKIQKLKNTDNLFELNVTVARIKTIEHSKQLRKRGLRYIRELFPNIIALLKKSWEHFTVFIREARKKAGFLKEKSVVSFELSEFLNEARQALNKLPFVYQRLYQIQPTHEDRFFVNRDKELGLLKRSYENWEKERFITCAVVGEKGSGTTSLINYFLRNVPSGISITKHTLGEKIYTSGQYFSFMNALLETSGIDSSEKLIEFINASPDRRIIILENLQHMFLKKVHGFEAMKLLFELMAHTSRKVMWVGIYTPVSWEYLDKTIAVSNYFTDEIRLVKMSDDIIREIIYKRNRLSGYQIRFLPTGEITRSKSFQKLDGPGKQRFLERQFFYNLNQLANGNISLAQLYWLRSTSSVDDRAIIISMVGRLDYSFIKDLTGHSLFALQVLLLHDGLTLEDFAKSMNESVTVCRNLLIPMLEKGFLIRPKQKFNINPIIYKPVTDYLSSRNFIH